MTKQHQRLVSCEPNNSVIVIPSLCCSYLQFEWDYSSFHRAREACRHILHSLLAHPTNPPTGSSHIAGTTVLTNTLENSKVTVTSSSVHSKSTYINTDFNTNSHPCPLLLHHTTSQLPYHLIIMDDNMHLRSMRRAIYVSCRDLLVPRLLIHCTASYDVCYARNNSRENENKVSDQSFHRLERSFQSPNERFIFDRPCFTIDTNSSSMDNHMQHVYDAWDNVKNIVDSFIVSTIATSTPTPTPASVYKLGDEMLRKLSAKLLTSIHSASAITSNSYGSISHSSGGTSTRISTSVASVASVSSVGIGDATASTSNSTNNPTSNNHASSTSMTASVITTRLTRQVLGGIVSEVKRQVLTEVKKRGGGGGEDDAYTLQLILVLFMERLKETLTNSGLRIVIYGEREGEEHGMWQIWEELVEEMEGIYCKPNLS
ncbi:hypothetical protein EON65_46275 [archaeon]|nr:MAG: hypothetical protein EON65_46275 [archaeon]